MNHGVLVISSDSETDRNSDYDDSSSLPPPPYLGGDVQNDCFSSQVKTTSCRSLEHDLSEGSSESESLPDVPFLTADGLDSQRYFSHSLNEIVTQPSKFSNSETNSNVASQTSSSQQSSEVSSSSIGSYNLSVVLEMGLCREKFFDTLKSCLDSAKISYSIEVQPFQGMVCWKDGSRPDFVDDQILLILNSSDVTEMVLNFKKFSIEPTVPTLLNRAHQIFQTFSQSKVTFIIFGMEKYFRSHKSNQTRHFREIVTGETLSQPNRKRNNKKNLPYLSKVDLDEAVVDLQLQTNVNVRLVDNPVELSDLIVSFTTAIKDAPRKRAKQHHNFNWHVHGDSLGTVKVGKGMKELGELWLQQLMQFHQVSKDTALAIVSRYPSPQLLLQAYQRCSSKGEATRLLENIEVRRGTALFATTKRVGPELSYKIHALFTTKDSNEILHSARE